MQEFNGKELLSEITGMKKSESKGISAAAESGDCRS